MLITEQVYYLACGNIQQLLSPPKIKLNILGTKFGLFFIDKRNLLFLHKQVSPEV